MTVRLLAFARARELLAGRRSIDVVDGSRVRDVWNRLVDAVPELSEVPGVRFAVDGTMEDADRLVRDGEELAILPAVGGG